MNLNTKKIKKNHKIFNEFNESFMSSLNMIVDENMDKKSENYDKLVSILREDDITFRLRSFCLIIILRVY